MRDTSVLPQIEQFGSKEEALLTRKLLFLRHAGQKNS